MPIKQVYILVGAVSICLVMTNDNRIHADAALVLGIRHIWDSTKNLADIHLSDLWVDQSDKPDYQISLALWCQRDTSNGVLNLWKRHVQGLLLSTQTSRASLHFNHQKPDQPLTLRWRDRNPYCVSGWTPSHWLEPSSLFRCERNCGRDAFREFHRWHLVPKRITYGTVGWS